MADDNPYALRLRKYKQKNDRVFSRCITTEQPFALRSLTFRHESAISGCIMARSKELTKKSCSFFISGNVENSFSEPI